MSISKPYEIFMAEMGNVTAAPMATVHDPQYPAWKLNFLFSHYLPY